jgi:anti-anti-sigma factor
MELKTKTNGKKKILILSDEVSGLDAIKLSKALESYKTGKCDEIIIDLSNVEYADSSCLGVLIYSQILLSKHNKKIILAAPQKYVSRIFRDFSFNEIFEIVESYES